MQKIFNTILIFWQPLKKLPVFAFTIGLVSTNIASHFLTLYTIVMMMISPQYLQYEGWIQVRVTGFGTVSYEKKIIEDYLTSQSGLSKSSKVMTTVYTDALPETGVINNGEVQDSDVSVLTNLDWKGLLRGKPDELKKINSQTFMSKLVSSKESKKCVCLYVGGIRNGKTSTYLNILKVRDPIESSIAKTPTSTFSNKGNDVARVCQVNPGEQILKRVDRA